jgi:LacI family transcriptional regulator
VTDPPEANPPDQIAEKRVRLVDVADAAGVSKGIASRILNHSPIPIRDETRDRVLQAADRLGYVPHRTARSLRSSRTGAVAFVVPDFTNPVWTRLIRGAFAEAHNNGLSLMVVEDRPDEGGSHVANLAVSGQVDGLIIASGHAGHPMLGDLEKYRVPHVFLNRGVPGSGRNVAIDQRRPTQLALEYLVGRGHTRVGHITGPLDLTTSQSRAEAFAHHARRLNLELAPVISGEFSERGGAEAARELLGRHPQVTAVTVSLLTQAVGVLFSASELGVDVPDQLAVLAHDDLDLAGYLQPPLTTVKIPLERVGAVAVEALVDQLNGVAPSDRVVVSEPELVIRRST